MFVYLILTFRIFVFAFYFLLLLIFTLKPFYQPKKKKKKKLTIAIKAQLLKDYNIMNDQKTTLGRNEN